LGGREHNSTHNAFHDSPGSLPFYKLASNPSDVRSHKLKMANLHHPRTQNDYMGAEALLTWTLLGLFT